jgi:drug/metabolite transporter (DMT)-like permease
LILKEKPTKRQAAGILLTLAGVLMTVIAVGAAASLSLSGYAMLLLAVVSYALYSISVRRAQAYTGVEITFVMLAFGAAVFGALALGEAMAARDLPGLLRLPFVDMQFLMAVLYQGIGCSVLAFFLSNVAIAKMGVNRTASFIGVSTVVSIVAGVLLLQEPFTPVQMAGAALILAGIYIANAKE